MDGHTIRAAISYAFNFTYVFQLKIYQGCLATLEKLCVVLNLSEFPIYVARYVV